MKNFKKALFGSLTLILGISYLSGLITQNSLGPWYDLLVKSPLNPPSWAFGVVWPLLYIMIAVAFARLISKSKKGSMTLWYFIIQLLLNFSWTPLFFGLKSPHLAFLNICALWAMILQNIFYYKKYDKVASGLLIPYFLWVSFAVYLNLFIVIHN